MRYRTPFLWPFTYAQMPDFSGQFGYAVAGTQEDALMVHSQVKQLVWHCAWNITWYPDSEDPIVESVSGDLNSLDPSSGGAFAFQTHWGWYYSGVSGELWPDPANRLLTSVLAEQRGAGQGIVWADNAFGWAGGSTTETRMSTGGLIAFQLLVNNALSPGPGINNNTSVVLNPAFPATVIASLPLELVGVGGPIQLGTLYLIKNVLPEDMPPHTLNLFEATLTAVVSPD